MVAYANASSGEKALSELQKILGQFGCTKFGNMTDAEKGSVIVQFEYRGRMVSVEASAKGWAAMYLREEPWSSRRKGSKAEYEARILQQGHIAVY